MPRIHPFAAAAKRAPERCLEAMNDLALPGLAVGLVRDGELAFARGFGVADAQSGRAVDENTVFRIGSISKTFTAVAVMQLVERGALDLDDAVTDHLRSVRIESPHGCAPPTIRQLLTHTSGIGELRSPLDLVRGPMASLGARPGSYLPSLAEYYAPALRTEVHPGTKWAYANHAFAVLGQLVEDVSGEPFEHVASTRIFEPLGMERTDFVRSSRVRDALAVGYRFRRGMIPVKDLEIVPRPAGSAYSSVADMARYVAALTGGGSNSHGSILKPETLGMMMHTHFTPDERLRTSMGLAFFLADESGHLVAGHDGGWSGFVSSMLVAPDDGVGVLCFTNSSRNINALAQDLMLDCLGLAAKASVPPAPSPWLWPELLGTYAPDPGVLTNARLWIGMGGEVAVTTKGGRLGLRMPSWTPPVAPTSFVHLRPSDPADPLLFEAQHLGFRFRAAFRRARGTTVDTLCVGAPLFATLRRRPALESIRTITRAGAALGAGVALRSALRRRSRR